MVSKSEKITNEGKVDRLQMQLDYTMCELCDDLQEETDICSMNVDGRQS